MTERLSGESSASLLDPNGPFARRLSRYEFRPAQHRMMTLVEQAFRDDGVLAVEAGTGTGKTFAYLAPAIRFAAETGEKVVVATHTIALQSQILEKDLPVVADALGIPIKAALIKGRGNYLCRRKVEEAIDAEERLIDPSVTGRPPEEHEALLRIGQWVRDHDEGSKAELGFVPPPELWEDLRSDRDSCLRTKCSHHMRCYFYQARRASARAEILIANHHLVLADLALKASLRGEGEKAPEGVLPAYSRLIIDEAHHLEEVAGSWFGAEASRAGVLRLLHRLAGGGRAAAFLPVLAKALQLRAGFADGMLRSAYLDAVDRIERRAIPHARMLEQVATIAFAEVAAWARAQPAEVSGGDGESSQKKVRLSDQPDFSFRHTVLPALSRLADPPDGLLGLADELSLIRKTALAGNEEAEPDLAGYLVDLSGRISALVSASAAIDDVAKGEGPGLAGMSVDRVRWIEIDEKRKAPSVRLLAAPVDLAPALGKHLFGAHSTVILTSATLSAGGDFSWLVSRTGLDRLIDGRLVTESLASPFDWPRQALIAVPTDLPAPDEEGFDEELPERVYESIGASKGGAFVLFTSYRLLRRVRDALAPRLAADGLLSLAQGDEDRHVLLERFRADGNAVLFATDSFWEGVDVPGDALRNVVITRLPFRVPSEPLLVARAERITARGGDPFAEMSVPEALLRFRQGLGRLIRTSTDRGIVVVLDKRIVQKSYGRRFRAALPPCRFETGYGAEVLGIARRFLEGGLE